MNHEHVPTTEGQEWPARARDAAISLERVSIIVPAFNEEQAIGQVVRGLRHRHPEAEIIVVDDGSRDRTSEFAAGAGALVLRHGQNRGYGASLKTGLRHATREFVVFVDGDGQHDPDDVARIVRELGAADMVVGVRTGQWKTPWTRRPGKLVLSLVARMLMGRSVPDVNSGLRGFRKDVLLRYLHLMPDGFSFSTTTTFAFLKANRAVAYVPIQVRRREGESTVSQLRDGLRAVHLMLHLIVLFEPLRVFLTAAAGVCLLGLASLVHDVLWNEQGVADVTVLLLLTSLLLFFFGLLADQIAALRREKHE
jgi:glycosyltransferase involved in cell wall biosynthesis